MSLDDLIIRKIVLTAAIKEAIEQKDDDWNNPLECALMAGADEAALFLRRAGSSFSGVYGNGLLTHLKMANYSKEYIDEMIKAKYDPTMVEPDIADGTLFDIDI